MASQNLKQRKKDGGGGRLGKMTAVMYTLSRTDVCREGAKRVGASGSVTATLVNVQRDVQRDAHYSRVPYGSGKGRGTRENALKKGRAKGR